MTKFREKYRNIDVLLIDDVQLYYRKGINTGRVFPYLQYVAGITNRSSFFGSSPEHGYPEDRIRSRFEWGLLDIRTFWLWNANRHPRKKQELDGYSVSDDVIEYIASNIKSNIRELKALSTKSLHTQTLKNVKSTLILQNRCCAISSPQTRRRSSRRNLSSTPLQITSILRRPTLSASKRTAKIVFPRQIAMYLCREMLNARWPESENDGDRDHTTVMHGIEKIERKWVPDGVTLTVDILKKKINPSK